MGLRLVNNTKTGYIEAEDGDGVVLNFVGRCRGRAQHGLCPTLQTDGASTGVVVTVPPRDTLLCDSCVHAGTVGGFPDGDMFDCEMDGDPRVPFDMDFGTPCPLYKRCDRVE